jgi:hypothetical protein
MRERSGIRALALILFAAAATEVFIALVAGIASDHGWSFLLNHFVVTNAVIGGSLAIAGLPIGWQRPRIRSAGCYWPGACVMPARLPRSRCWLGDLTPEINRPSGG